MLRPAILTLCLLASTFATLCAQDATISFPKAKSVFDRGVRSGETKELIAGISVLVSTRDPKGVKVLQVALHKARKNLAKVKKKLVRPNRTLKKLSDSLVKKVLLNNRTTTGLKLQRDIDKIRKKIEPLEAARGRYENTKESLLVGLGDLIASLDDGLREAETNKFITHVAKLKDTAARLDNLEILGHIHGPQAVLGLVGIALNNTDPIVRIAAIEALADLGDSRGSEAALVALDDEYWQVRTTAVRSLERIGHIDAIGKLIKRLGAEQGRLRGDIIESLSAMTGQDFRENAAVWAKWWKDQNEHFRGLLKSLETGNGVERDEAMRQVGAEGFLLSVRLMLDKEGLSDNAIRHAEALTLDDPEKTKAVNPGGVEGVSGADGTREVFHAMVGQAIGSRKPAIRDHALDVLLIQPWRRTKNENKKAELTRLIGRTGAKRAAEILVRVVLNSDVKNSLKLAAVEGLGYSAKSEQTIFLGRLFGNDSADAELLLLAARALGEVGTHRAVNSLIQGLRELSGRSEMEGVVKAGLDELRTMTGRSEGNEVAPWVTWWKANKEGFGTKKDQLAAAKKKEGGEDEDDRYGFYGIKTFSKRIAYVLDVSGSMNEEAGYAGERRTKIDVAKSELLKSISALPKDAEFSIIIYSTDFRLWQKKIVTATADNKKKAKAWISKIEAVGGTNIYDALAKAFELAGRGTFDKGYKTALDTIFFLSDGQPTMGEHTDTNVILAECRKLNKLRKVQIHTIGVGKDHAKEFMRALAVLGRGDYVSR